jgi:hypothetical protein
MGPVIRLATTTAVVLAVLASTALAAPTARVYDGTGKRTLAPFRLTQTTTLRWQTSGGLFGGLFSLRIINPRADILNPQLAFTRARTGSVRLAAGTYTLRVESVPGTRWRITIG